MGLWKSTVKSGVSKLMIKKVDFEIAMPQTTKKDIQEFLLSGWDACEIDVSKFKTATSAYQAYSYAIKSMNCSEVVSIIKRKEQIFLVRTKEEIA